MIERHVFTCRELVELVTEYEEGALATEERLAFEHHVAICPPCRGYLAQLRRTIRLGEAVRDDELPEPLRAALIDAFRDWRRASGR